MAVFENHRYRLSPAWPAFADAEIEQAFELAEFTRRLPGVRARAGVSGAALAAFTAMVLSFTRTWPATGFLALVWILYGLVIVAVRTESRRPLHAAATGLFAVGGSALVAVTAFAAHVPHGWSALVVLLTYFQLQSTSIPLLVLALSVVPEVVVGCVAAWTTGETVADATVTSVLLVLSYLVALMVGTLSRREARRAYAYERVIEEQRTTIAEQQQLLKRELSHQVAERSRELGAVLAKSDVTFDVRRLSPGERFAERYRIVSALGAGGMGAVYEVERVTDGEKLALKAVVGEVSGVSAARFAREAEIGARIRHPNLVAIVDVGVSSGVPFLTMELVRGGSLEAQRSKFGDVAWALPILRQICDGLAALHDAGVVHRDLKPGNVLLADGVAKISDFGISRFGELDDAASIDPVAETMAVRPRSGLVTGTGVILGTPLYMAPEAARGGRQLDASADVFALGILAYEMLTGRSPFAVPAFVLAMAEQPTPAVAPIDDARVPEPLRQIVARALDGDPSERPRLQAIRAALG